MNMSKWTRMTAPPLELSPASDSRLRWIADSGQSRRIIMICFSAGATTYETMLVTVIAVVECSARPLDARFVEWLVALSLRSGLLGSVAQKRGRSITVGPFQLRNAPFRLAESTLETLTRVRECLRSEKTLREIGVWWNGSQAETRHTAPYSNVLLSACIHVSARQRRMEANGLTPV